MNYKISLINYYINGFVVIKKVFSAKDIDKNFKDGLGVMLDDVVAGVFSACAVIAMAFPLSLIN